MCEGAEPAVALGYDITPWISRGFFIQRFLSLRHTVEYSTEAVQVPSAQCSNSSDPCRSQTCNLSYQPLYYTDISLITMETVFTFLAEKCPVPGGSVFACYYSTVFPCKFNHC